MEGPSLEVRQKSRKVPSVPLPESRVLEEADLFGGIHVYFCAL